MTPAPPDGPGTTSLTARVLVGLLAGFLLGLALGARSGPVAGSVINLLGVAGTIFVNLIRMTVIPLVVSMLVASLGAIAASNALGRLGLRATVLAVAILTVAATVSLLVAQPILASVRVDRAATVGLAAGSPDGSTAMQGGGGGLERWMVDLVPPNPFRSAADGAMLPIIVFTVLFALALGGVSDDRRSPVLAFARGCADAMQRLVVGILELAPIGVFALAVPLAARLGLAAAGAVFVYVALVVALTVVVGAVMLYPLAVIGGGMPVAGFVRFCAPAQAVAFAARSSLAALPAMIESADAARFPPLVSGFLLPLAASVFRVGGAVAQTVGVLFLARLYDVTLSAAALVSIVVTVVLTTFAVPGIPGGSIVAMVPVLAAANLPMAGIGVLLAVDTIPDMFRTTANVTGSLALAAVVARWHRPMAEGLNG